MKTVRMSISPTQIDAKKVDAAAALLRAGGLVALPTETVYGLAANALDETAVRRIFQVKGRPQDNPLIVHIADIAALKDLVLEIPDAARALAGRFWPGPLTMVLRRASSVPARVSAGLPSVAVRLPDHPVMQAVIRACGFPLAAPSANRSGSPSPTSAAHVLADLDGRIEGVVDSDNSRVGVESTVVDLTRTPPVLLRPGGVTPEQLRVLLPDLQIDPAVLREPAANSPVSSPGMKYRHYAPRAQVTLIEADTPSYVSYLNKTRRPGLFGLCFSEDAPALQCPYIVYGTGADALSLAQGLFCALRRCDEAGAETVLAHAPAQTGVGLAVYNRLLRAAAFRVIRL